MSDKKNKRILHYMGNGGLVCGAGRKLLNKGDRLPDDHGIDDVEMASLEAKGLVMEYTGPRGPSVPNDGFTGAGMEASHPKAVAMAPDPNAALPAGWTFDPTALADKDLPTLNNLIADHALRIKTLPPQPFDTVEEARAWLSRDFVKRAPVK